MDGQGIWKVVTRLLGLARGDTAIPGANRAVSRRTLSP
jgi:hypothetical protein